MNDFLKRNPRLWVTGLMTLGALLLAGAIGDTRIVLMLGAVVASAAGCIAVLRWKASRLSKQLAKSLPAGEVWQGVVIATGAFESLFPPNSVSSRNLGLGPRGMLRITPTTIAWEPDKWASRNGFKPVAWYRSDTSTRGHRLRADISMKRYPVWDVTILGAEVTFLVAAQSGDLKTIQP
jgi:hypothetical protein